MMIPIIPGFKIPEPPHKHNYAVWVYPSSDYKIYPECSACCETELIKPSYFCPNCGALMLNVYDARSQYESDVSELKKEQNETEGANNDIE